MYTCGIFLFNKHDELLIVHPTNAPFTTWSIPKGLMDEGETVIETAIRELYEETNIDLNKLQTVYLRQGTNVPYASKKKILCPVYCKVLKGMEEIELKCNSLVDDCDFYENDYVVWHSKEKALTLIHETQIKAFHAHKI